MKTKFLRKTIPSVRSRRRGATDFQQAQKRRTSARSIRRKKFDDELVESSLSKSKRGKTPNFQSVFPDSNAVPSTSSTRTFMEKHIEARKRKANVIAKIVPKIKTVPRSVGKTIARRRKLAHAKKNVWDDEPTPPYWKPADDLALILNVLQTNDLWIVHEAIKFSSPFTLSDVENRWRALLYDPVVSNAAVAAIRQLPQEELAYVESKVLYNEEEEALIGSVSKLNGSLDDFKLLISKSMSPFLHNRTPAALRDYWAYMKRYNLLSDQTTSPCNESLLTFSDAEEMTDDDLLKNDQGKDEELKEELRAENLKMKKQIRELENEMVKLDVLFEKATGYHNPEEFDILTIASLKGRTVSYLVQSQEVTMGRSDISNVVDIDLSLEGPAFRVSRRQGVIRMDKDGNFFMINEGKRPVFIDGKPILTNEKCKLINNSVVEMGELSLTFHTNPEGIAHMKKNFSALLKK